MMVVFNSAYLQFVQRDIIGLVLGLQTNETPFRVPDMLQ